MTNALAVINSSDEFETIQRTGRMLAASGFFGVNGESPQAIAQMATKVLAGRELGFGPFASVNGIHIINGKPAVGANLMAAAVKGHPTYDYRVRKLDNSECVIEFFQRAASGNLESIGVSSFSMQDAQAAGVLNNPTWKKYPKNMLFARAMSNGVRWYCPDVFSGNAVYVPEELGAEVDGDGNVVEGTWQEAPPEPEPKPKPQAAKRPQPEPDHPFEDDGDRDVDFGMGGKGEPEPEPDKPTNDELEVLSTWQTPDDARQWAVDVGACDNIHEAKNSFAKIVDDHGGRLTKSNVGAVYLAFLRRQNEKLAELQPA